MFLFYPDRFQKPNPFQPDVVVAIDDVIEQKLDALVSMESQFYEGGALGNASMMPSEPAKQEERRRQVRESFAARNRAIADRYRNVLADWYGKEAAAKVAIRRGLRNLRIRPPAQQGRAAEAVSLPARGEVTAAFRK